MRKVLTVLGVGLVVVVGVVVLVVGARVRHAGFVIVGAEDSPVSCPAGSTPDYRREGSELRLYCG